MSKASPVNLGYPLKIRDVPATPSTMWGMEVAIDHDKDGMPLTVPICFTAEQAREIARRIREFYGDA